MDFEQTDPSTIEAALVTDKGTMVITFFPEQAPQHVRGFLKLAQQGFYDGIAFHRIVRNFMIQTGCPNTKKGAKGQPGTGGPGYQLPAEFNDIPHTRGTVSMARTQDPNSAGSQFFIVHGEHAQFLDGQYTVFGKVEAGLEVLDEIASLECDFGAGGERSKPKERVEIRNIELRPRQLREQPKEASGEVEAEGS
ncbi:MAG TPA: peptidylprolyl isomerase [Planctomycetota bacterium]|nr:peptidylprolyl isomerase [Planctomycetota bacterium]